MTVIAHIPLSPTSNYGGTSPPVDMTGVNFIAAVVGAYANGGVTSAHLTFTDSNSNTYIGRTIYSVGASWCRIYYCANPTVGTGMTFTLGGGYPSYATASIIGTDDTVTGVGAQNGAASSGTQTTLATGSATPATSNSLVIAGFNSLDNGTGTVTVTGGFSIIEKAPWVSGQPHEGSYIAALYTTSTSALNPTFTIPTASTAGLAAAISVFELASTGVGLNALAQLKVRGAAQPSSASGMAGIIRSSARGKPSLAGSASLSGIAAARTGGRGTVGRSTSLTGVGRSRLTAGAVPSGATALTGRGRVLSFGRSAISGAVGLSGKLSVAVGGSGAASAIAYLAAQARASIMGAATVTRSATLAAVGIFQAIGRGVISGPGALSAVSTMRAMGKGAAVATAALTARASGKLSAKSLLSGPGALSARGTARVSGAGAPASSTSLSGRTIIRLASPSRGAAAVGLAGRLSTAATGRATSALSIALGAVARVMAWASGLITVSGTVIPPLDDAGFVAATLAETYIPATTRTTYIPAMNRWRP